MSPSSSSITDQTSLLAAGGVNGLIGLVVYVLLVIALWRVFTKAGHPGWLAVIPVVNAIFLVKIAGFSGWWSLLYLIPFVNIVFYVIVQIRVGKAFGHGVVFSIFLLVLLHIIGYLIIGFSDDKYRPERLRA